MSDINKLLDNNLEWSAEINARDPEFFPRLARQQRPEFLWIGCSDSRVPANEIVNLLPGELFVHRNVANVVVHTDLNCLSVLQYAVDVLRVRHVIVCGHYGCGGIEAAFENRRLGMIDNWLRHVQDVHAKHFEEIAAAPRDEQLDRLAELNVIEQVLNVARTSIVGAAWDQGQQLSIHGWIYGLRNGRIEDLGVTVSSPRELRAMQLDTTPRHSDIPAPRR